MGFNLKNLLSSGPESISAEKVVIREVPLEEIGLTLLFVIIAGFWFVFSGDVVDWIMGIGIDSPVVLTLRGINFVTTTGLVLYVVLRRSSSRRRQAMEALRLSQQRFESVALATTDAIWDLNLETKVVWWSDGMQKLFGYPLEEVSSKYEWWLQRVHPEDRDRVTESIRKVVEGGGKNWSGEYRFRRQDETYASVLDRGYIIRDSTGKPVRLVGGLSDLSEQRMAERALANYREQLRALTARLQTGREEERANMAREIHDDLGQTLTAIKLDLDWLERHIAQQKNETAWNPLLERVVESGEMIESAIQSVQRISADLRPALLDNLGLGEALQEESQRFEQRSGVKCVVQLPPQTLRFAPQISIAIFRVFQESLTNVARHAEATEVNISLKAEKGLVTLRTEDNGKGISPKAIGDSRSLGLIGMMERAYALGGNVSFEPITPCGTRVTLQLPLGEAGIVPGAKP